VPDFFFIEGHYPSTANCQPSLQNIAFLLSLSPIQLKIHHTGSSELENNKEAEISAPCFESSSK
jgi:hypothetical protein